MKRVRGQRAQTAAWTFFVLLLVLLAAAPAIADDGQPLPADQAFHAQVKRTGPHMLAVTWHIADGYYLYRRAFSFKLIDGGPARLGQAQIPPGKHHRDAYFGPVETYRHQVTISVPVIGQRTSQAKLVVSYRGCADAGLCYPPQQQRLTLPPPQPDRTEQDTPAATAQASAPDKSDRLATGLGHSGLVYTIGLFFILGLGLAFTPCSLPMIPIIAGMLGTREHSRRRAGALASAYVLAMAVAYGLFGLVAGYFGTNLQAWLQRPVVLLVFAGVFVLLAAASFGWFTLELPSRWQTRLSAIGNGRGGLAGAAVLGFFAALIAGPCLAPPLAGALLYISSTGDLATGTLALFALGLGIGTPLIALAVFGVGILPRSGSWMAEVRVFFGVLLLAVGLWLALRLAPPTLALASWGGLALIYGAYLSTRPTISIGATVCKRVILGLVFGYAALAGSGLAIGGGRPGAPLAGLAGANSAPGASDNTQAIFKHITSPERLSQAIAGARHHPVMVDIYADWCVDCVRMKHTVFADPAVRHALSRVTAIEFDVTAYTPAQRRLMQRLKVFGPPTLLFFRAHDSVDTPARRLVGAVDAARLRETLSAMAASAAR